MIQQFLEKYQKQMPLLLMVFAGILFIPFLGNVHLFDWDEINFAEAAREMILTGNYLQVQIDYQPFWEKPPLFIWMQVLSMKVFGINEFAARLPNAFCGMITLPLLYLIGRELRNSMFGLFWTLAYVGSFLPHFYFHSGIIDPWFNLFIVLGILLPFVPSIQNIGNWSFAMSGVFIGLAVLTKGPVALLIACAVFGIYGLMFAYTSKTYRILFTWIKNIAISGSISLFVASLWFGIEILNNGTWFVEEFVRYQIRLFSTGDAGHSGPFYYHALVLLLGCFPASFVALPALSGKKKVIESDTIMLILLWFVLVLFSIVKTKIVHYSSLCYFPLTYLAALQLQHYHERNQFSERLRKWLIPGVVLWTILFMTVPIIGLYKNEIIPLLKDEFVKALLQADVHWNIADLFIGIFYLLLASIGLYLLHKKTTWLDGIVILFLAGIPAILLFLPITASKIEGYTQAAPIEYYQSMKNKDVLVYPSGFKSYAHLFYSGKLPASKSKQQYTEDELMNGAESRPVYFVAKLKKAKEMRNDTRFQEVFTKNGFSAFKVVNNSLKR